MYVVSTIIQLLLYIEWTKVSNYKVQKNINNWFHLKFMIMANDIAFAVYVTLQHTNIFLMDIVFCDLGPVVRRPFSLNGG